MGKNRIDITVGGSALIPMDSDSFTDPVLFNDSGTLLSWLVQTVTFSGALDGTPTITVQGTSVDDPSVGSPTWVDYEPAFYKGVDINQPLTGDSFEPLWFRLEVKANDNTTAVTANIKLQKDGGGFLE